MEVKHTRACLLAFDASKNLMCAAGIEPAPSLLSASPPDKLVVVHHRDVLRKPQEQAPELTLDTLIKRSDASKWQALLQSVPELPHPTAI